MKRPLLFISFVTINFLPTYSQTFNGTGGTIQDLALSYFDISVSGLSSSLDTVYGLESVCVDINHSRTGELDIYLQAPDGTLLVLSNGNGGTGDDYDNTCFSDGSDDYIQNGDAPFQGVFHPEGAISYMNNGQDGNGTWRLYVNDFATGGTGFVDDWQLNFGNSPPQPFSSNLPIIKINAGWQTIPNEPKILARMEIIDNGPGMRNHYFDPPNNYNSWIGIEIRGSSSQQFPKKSFGFETTDSLLNDTSVSLLGFPPENDWILNASFSDKTFIRNVLAYTISSQMGHYATRWKHCEVFLDGEYLGIYIFSEKIKRDNNRVDIAKLTPADTTGDELTGGYILKIDKTLGTWAGWTSAYPPAFSTGPNPTFQYEYPDMDDILPVQEAYIQNFIDSLEDILAGPGFNDPVTGYRSMIDVNSFVDYFLVNEVSKNIDGYRISTFMHKDKDSNGGLLKMGPVWDYDIAWGNADYYLGQYVTGWSYQFYVGSDDFQVPFWWDRLVTDPLFETDVRCRYNSLRTSLLSTSFLHGFVGSLATELDEAQQRNFRRWMILGEYVWPNPQPFPPDYPGVIDELKNYISGRMALLDSILPGNCFTGISSITDRIDFIVYPNPSNGNVNIRVHDFHENLSYKLIVFSMDGRKVTELMLEDNRGLIENLSPGAYLFEFNNSFDKHQRKVIVTQ